MSFPFLINSLSLTLTCISSSFFRRSRWFFYFPSLYSYFSVCIDDFGPHDSTCTERIYF
jgi:hypothetical protein